jgi:hypothetical protein
LRKANTTSLGRMVLALIAVLAVAGPGLVLAGSPSPSYPNVRYADIVTAAGGAVCVSNGSSVQLMLQVTQSDNSKGILTSGVTWSVSGGGSIASDGTYTAPATGDGVAIVRAAYSTGFASGRANRAIHFGTCAL